MFRRTKKKESEITVVKTADSCLAKTYSSEEGKIVPGRTVYEHCMIVGSIAATLLRSFPIFVQELFPKGTVLLAACHDVGKLSPTFYSRLQLALGSSNEEASKLCQEIGLDFEIKELSNYEHNWGGHPGISFLVIKEMTQSDGTSAWVVGAHHGACPKTDTCSIASRYFGGNAWEQEREKLVQRLEGHFQEELPKSLTPYQSWLIAGLTTTSDWIGSGTIFDKPEEDWRPLIETSVRRSGFSPLKIRKKLQFGDIFRSNLGAAFTPNEIQTTLAKEVTGPGIYILEAPMGTGKTEAALFAAYQMLKAEKARGVYFALPSQLTANKIYERFVAFIGQIKPESTPVQLLHSKAKEFLEHVQFNSPETDPGGSWFAYRKRGVLAPFAVGTIDQILLAVMSVRFNFLRVFGLVGKVVIIDEVHSYDAFTNVLLTELLKLLKFLNCVVIILSATLTKQARSKLLGCQSKEVQTIGYPQLSQKRLNERLRTVTPMQLPSDNVAMSLKYGREGESNASDEAISRALSGQQVLWIENDVASSQEIYKVLSARTVDLGVECGLLHSRFTIKDRSTLEDYWVNLYGKKGKNTRRERGRILVGTQVLEQSLDIDADFLVSRIVVMDMLFQRIGRLWRHSSTTRPTGTCREVWVLTPKLEEALDNPRDAMKTTARIYWPYYLCRTLEVLSNKTELIVPGDIPKLLEATYESRQEQGVFATLYRELIDGNRELRIDGIGQREHMAQTQLAVAFGDTVVNDDYVSTRYFEEQTVELLLVRKLKFCSGITKLKLWDGSEVSLPWKRSKLEVGEWRKRALMIASNLVRIKEKDASGFRISNSQGFQHVLFLGDNCEGLYVGVVLSSGDVMTYSGMSTNFHYSKTIGWEKQRREEKNEKF